MGSAHIMGWEYPYVEIWDDYLLFSNKTGGTMETLSATTIFWLLVLGATTGWALGYWVGHEGVTLVSNVFWGMVGALITGLIALYVAISGVLLFGFISTLAVLFIVNVFHLHHEEDLEGQPGHENKIRIVHRPKS